MRGNVSKLVVSSCLFVVSTVHAAGPSYIAYSNP